MKIAVFAAAGLLLVACGTAGGSASHPPSSQPATVQPVPPVAPIAIDQAAARRNGSPAKPNTSQPVGASAPSTKGSRSLEPADPLGCGPTTPAQPNLHKVCPG